MDKMDLANAAWRKSSYSGANGDCVEVAVVPGVVAMRDSKDPSGPALVFSPGEFAAFMRAIAGGEFGRV